MCVWLTPPPWHSLSAPCHPRAGVLLCDQVPHWAELPVSLPSPVHRGPLWPFSYRGLVVPQGSRGQRPSPGPPHFHRVTSLPPCLSPGPEELSGLHKELNSPKTPWSIHEAFPKCFVNGRNLCFPKGLWSTEAWETFIFFVSYHNILWICDLDQCGEWYVEGDIWMKKIVLLTVKSTICTFLVLALVLVLVLVFISISISIRQLNEPALCFKTVQLSFLSRANVSSVPTSWWLESSYQAVPLKSFRHSHGQFSLW